MRGFVGQSLTGLDKESWVTPGERWPRSPLADSRRSPPRSPPVPCCPSPVPLSPARSREVMMNFPRTALQTVINNALLFGDGTFH